MEFVFEGQTFDTGDLIPIENRRNLTLAVTADYERVFVLRQSVGEELAVHRLTGERLKRLAICIGDEHLWQAWERDSFPADAS